MYSKILWEATNRLKLEEIDILRSFFSKEDISGTTITEKPDIDYKFLNMANSFFEASYALLLKAQENNNGELSEALTVFHNLFIGLELGLKAVLSGYSQIKGELWMVQSPDIQFGHNLEALIKNIRKYSSEFFQEDDNWLDVRLDIILKFITLCDEESIFFLSTRYPIDRNGNPYGYLYSDSILHLDQLKIWIEVLYKSILDLSSIHDYLDGARSHYPYSQ